MIYVTLCLLLVNLDALSLHTKRKPVEIYLAGKQLQEELQLLEDEMLRFLHYYKDHVMPSLDAHLNTLSVSTGMSLLSVDCYM